jgi:lipopolysaccharide export system permease protein
MLKQQKSYSSQSFAMNVGRVEGHRLINCTLTLYARGNTPEITIRAGEAELHADFAQGVLKIWLRNGTIDYGGKYTLYMAQSDEAVEWELPLSDASRDQDSSSKPSWLPLWQIPRQEAEQQETIKRLERELAARAAYQMLCGDFDELGSRQWEGRAQTLALQRGQLFRLLAEPHRRWSAGFSCLCFACVGIPMAIRLRNRDFLSSFFLCFLPILIVYYPLLFCGVKAAKHGSLPPYSVWAGNVLLMLWGTYLLRKVLRY